MKKKTTEGKKKATISSEQKFGLENLVDINQRAITNAIPRYFPNCNLQIERLNEAIVGLVGGNEFRVLVEDFARENRKKLEDASREMNSVVLPESKQILREFYTLATSIPGGREAIVKARRAISCADKHIQKLYKEMDSGEPTEMDEQRKEENKRKKKALTGYSYALSDVKQFLSGADDYEVPNACGLYEKGSLFMSGEWGVGKTHSLCALAAKQMEQDLPVLLVLAESFDPGEFPGDALAQCTGLAENLDGLLQGLDALGREAGVRALLLIDSVNESPNDGLSVWRRGLGGILKQVRRFPHVGLVVSCRDPLSATFPAAVKKQMPYWEHRGFDDLDKAQRAYLEHYGISPSDTPLIGEDVARPLTLKIICEEISQLPPSKREARYDEIVSGQVGINAVFERYIKRRAKVVGKEHPVLLTGNNVWHLVKEDLAGYMAKNLTHEMPENCFLKAVRERCSVDLRQAKEILSDMADKGIINRRRVFAGAGRQNAGKQPPIRAVIQMPFQRLGDHIVARKLLRNLDTASAETVRESFAADKPLGKIFLPGESHKGFPTKYAIGIAGWREALILEFPERVSRLVEKKKIPNKQRELLFNLPDPESMRKSLNDPFMRGLHMRANKHINTTTVQMVDECLCDWESMASQGSGISYMGQGIAESALSLSRRRHSLLSARCYLYSRHVKPMKMPDRDVLWGSVTRQARRTGWTNSLFAWLDGLEERDFPVPVSVVRNYIVLLSLFLGATDRPLRDKATQALVAIGEWFPAELFFHALDMMGFDDIYYPERMLAACYSVAMARWGDSKAKKFHNVFPEFARAVVRDVFMPDGRLLTHHALVRDYALGIADIARKLNTAFTEDEEARMSPPFSAVPPPFPAAFDIDEAELSDMDFALGMDFKNYTIGRLVPNRINYDFSNEKYADIMRQIKWRMRALGCTADKFAERDKRHQENRWDSNYGKVDRYGKKYSWIAYYEMCGWLHAQGRKTSEWQDMMRSVDGAIDPSFPVAPPQWNPEFKPLSMDDSALPWISHGPSPDYGHILERNELNGISGPWVMLEGFVVHKNKEESRELSSFLHGLLVQKSNILRLQTALQASEYPGREPDLEDFYRVFAGEIPWSPALIHEQGRMEKNTGFSTVPVETVAINYAWEEGEFSTIYFPLPDICARLGLSRRGRGSGLFDEHGHPASLYHADKNRSGIGVSSLDEFQFLHIRKDLLDEYLQTIGKRLVWIVWGERRLLQRDWAHAKPWPPEVETAMDNHLHIHKRLVVYPLNKG